MKRETSDRPGQEVVGARGENRATWFIDPGEEDMVDVAGDLAMMAGLPIRMTMKDPEARPRLLGHPIMRRLREVIPRV